MLSLKAHPRSTGEKPSAIILEAVPNVVVGFKPTLSEKSQQPVQGSFFEGAPSNEQYPSKIKHTTSKIDQNACEISIAKVRPTTPMTSVIKDTRTTKRSKGK